MSTLQEDRNTTKADVYWLVGWTAVLLWDNIITISSAHRYLMKAKRTPMKGLYILNRYGTVIFQSLCMMMVVLAVPMNLCRSIFWFQCFALVYVITICSIILSIRCWALFERGRKMMVLLLLMLALEIGLLVGTVSQLRPLVLTPGASVILDFQGCVAVAASSVTRKLSIVFWSSTLAFNTMIFGLTMWKSTNITKKIRQHVTIWKRLQKAGIVYYLVILVSNLACVIFYSVKTERPLQTFNTPASVVLVSLMSSRLVVYLWSENYRSSRLSIDSFVSTSNSQGQRSPPPSPKSYHSIRSNKSRKNHLGGGVRRDSDDYDKVGPLEQSEQVFKVDLSSSTLPTLSYNNNNSQPQYHHRRSASIHSRHGSILNGGDEGLPKFEGVVVILDQLQQKEDTRSVKSEGGNKVLGKNTSTSRSGSSGRDGTASV